MSEYDDSGKVALWTNESENPRAPVYKGHAFAHRDIKKGEKVAVSLWENEAGERRPKFRGKLEDVRSGRETAQETAPAVPATPAKADLPFDDDIPFS